MFAFVEASSTAEVPYNYHHREGSVKSFGAIMQLYIQRCNIFYNFYKLKIM